MCCTLTTRASRKYHPKLPRLDGMNPALAHGHHAEFLLDFGATNGEDLEN